MHESKPKLPRLRAQIAFAVCLLLTTLGLSAATAQEAELQRQLSESFELLTLRDGLVFRCLDPELGVSAIELIGDDLVVDGVSVSLEELEARLGERAAPFRSLLALAPEDRREWIESGRVSVPDGPSASVEAEPGAVADSEVESAPAPDDGQVSDANRRAEVRRRIDRARRRSDAQVVIASPLTVEEDEVSRDVVVLGGSLTVAGRVIGDAAAIGGSARVSGEIDGDLSVVGGSVTLEEGAEVRGDVVSVGGEVVRDDNAVVLGQVLEVPFGPAIRIGDWDWRADRDDRDDDSADWGWDLDHRRFSFSPLGYMFGIGWEIFFLAILALLACLVLLLAPNPVEQVRRRVVEEPWKSGLVGLLSQVLFGPVVVLVCLILVISVIGIPLLILVPFALFGLLLVAFLGYTAVALAVGRWLEQRFGWQLATPYVALLVGFAAIQGLGFIGDLLDVGPLWFFSVMFGLLGGLVCYLAWTVGFGAAVLTRFGTAPGWGDDGSWMPSEGAPSYAEGAAEELPAPPELPPDVADWDEPPEGSGDPR